MTWQCDCGFTRHQHGTRATYVAHRCRCADCREANRVVQAARRRQQLYGRYDAMVDAGPVQERLQALIDAGLSIRQIVKLTGASRTSLCVLLQGKRSRVRAETAEMIRSLTPSLELMAPNRDIPALGTARRIKALVWLGHPISWQAETSGVKAHTLYRAITADAVKARTALAVRDLYEAYWDKPPQPTDWPGRIRASKARAWARREGWLPPMAWDDPDTDRQKRKAKHYGEETGRGAEKANRHSSQELRGAGPDRSRSQAA